MNITKEDIMHYVQEKYDYLKSKMNSSHILGIFIVGNVNYGFAESLKEATPIAIYLPSFDDLCTSRPNHYIDNDIVIIDIRLLYNAFDECEWGSLELLYSNYKIINPIYLNAFTKYFLNNRDKIANCDKFNRVSICYNKMTNAIKEHNYFEAARLEIACDLYLNGVSCDEIFHLSKDYHVEYLWEIKRKERNIDTAKIFNSFDEMIWKCKSIKPNREEMDKIIKQGVITLMTVALKEKVSIDNFYSCLTKTEKSALKELLNRVDINGEGNISISKIVDETGISRPVYKNLFTKLEKNKVAEIGNQGVKGTYINFDMSLFN